MARRVATGTGALVLDAEGLCKAAQDDPRVGAFLKQALREQGRVIVSAVTLAEVLRGHGGDAAVHRVLAKVNVVPVTVAVGRAAGLLLGRTGGDDTVDAVVAATAAEQAGRVLVLTSDTGDLSRLTAGHGRIRVQHV